MIDAAADWAAATGPPNWAFVLALLTHPKVWSGAAVRTVKKRLLDDSSGEEPADGEGEA